MRIFLAILKDSFKEAIDAKVLYVLTAFSLLFSILCLSISFKVKPYDEALRGLLQGNSFEAANVPMPKATVNLVRPEVSEIVTDSGELKAVIKVVGHDTFKAYIYPRMMPAGLPDPNASPSDLEVAVVEGEKGFERYLRARLIMGGFVPKKLAKTGEHTYELTCKPMGAFKTQGATSIILFFGITPAIDIGEVSARDVIFGVQQLLVNTIAGWIGILISIVVTAWFLPNMLRKGSVDLLLARPAPRWQLFVSKYLGGLLFVFVNAAILITGTWIGFTIGTGFFHPGYLLSIVTLTLLFAIVYSISCLAGVLFGNVVLCIVFPIGFWFLCYLVNTWKLVMDTPQLKAMFNMPDALRAVSNAVYYVLPKTTDLGKLSDYFLVMGEEKTGVVAATAATLGRIDFAGSIITSVAFTAAVVALSAWIFHKKDY